MAYASDAVVRRWLAALDGLKIDVKKMFGCYCVYCDGQPVGWLSETCFSLREVGLPDLPQQLKRPLPDDPVREIVIPPEACGCEWLPKAVQDTADLRRAEKGRHG